MCCTHYKCLLQYNSGFMNFSGDGISTFDFIVSVLTGDDGWKLPESFITSTFMGLKVRILSTSVVSVRRDSLSRPCSWFFNKAESLLFLTECVFQTPPMRLASILSYPVSNNTIHEQLGIVIIRLRICFFQFHFCNNELLPFSE